MRRRRLLSAAPALLAVPAGLAALPADAFAAGERYRYRHRRGRHRTGLLLRDIEGTASLGRRYGDFEGDLLIRQLHYGRVLHVSGAISGEVDLEGRRRDFELDVDANFRRADAVLSHTRRRLTLDVGEIELYDLGRRELEVDPDAQRVDDLRGPFARKLEELLHELAAALADEGGYRKTRHKDDEDIDDLIDRINAILSRTLHTVDDDRHRAG